MLLFFLIYIELKGQVVSPFPNSRTNNFTMPAVKGKGLDLPKFKVSNNKIPSKVNRQLMIPAVGGGSNGPAPVVTPIQFPGILNPDIYIQNSQSAPIFPQLNAPPINMNLHINGIEKYYKRDPAIVHHIHHYHKPTDPYKQFFQALVN